MFSTHPPTHRGAAYCVSISTQGVGWGDSDTDFGPPGSGAWFPVKHSAMHREGAGMGWVGPHGSRLRCRSSVTQTWFSGWSVNQPTLVSANGLPPPQKKKKKRTNISTSSERKLRFVLWCMGCSSSALVPLGGSVSWPPEPRAPTLACALCVCVSLKGFLPNVVESSDQTRAWRGETHPPDVRVTSSEAARCVTRCVSQQTLRPLAVGFANTTRDDAAPVALRGTQRVTRPA